MKKIVMFILLSSLISCVYFPDGREVWEPVPLLGVIMDCNSNVVVAGALVASSNHSDKVETDANGIFRIEGKRTIMHIASFSDSYENGILTVSAKGFANLNQNIRYGSPSHKEKDLGVLCLSYISSN